MTVVLRLASLVLPSLLLLGLPARADDIYVGTAPVCDTQQQMERFVKVFDGDAQSAVTAVNTEVNDPTACVIVTMAYVPESTLATIRNNNTTFEIVPVLVLGFVTPEGVQAIEPARFFSALQLDGIDI
jgi:hypothetical protein